MILKEHKNIIDCECIKKHIVVYHGNEKRDIEITGDTTPFDILKHFDQNPDVIIVVRNSTPIPLDETLNSGDTIKLIQITSRG